MCTITSPAHPSVPYVTVNSSTLSYADIKTWHFCFSVLFHIHFNSSTDSNYLCLTCSLYYFNTLIFDNASHNAFKVHFGTTESRFYDKFACNLFDKHNNQRNTAKRIVIPIVINTNVS